MGIYSRNKRVGLVHRNKLRAMILPRLRVGCRVPTAAFLGRLLRINPSEAWRHMRRVLAEAGVVTETRGGWRARRVFVVAMRNDNQGKSA